MQIERQQIRAGHAHPHPAVARQVLGARHAEDQRQRLGAHQAVLHRAGHQFGDVVLLQPAQRPVTLDAVLEIVVGGVGGVEGRDDREQRRILRLERRRQRRGAAVAGAGDDLPLVDQIDIAPQRRRGPGVLRHAHAGMRRRPHAHAHLDARRHARLAAVDARHAAFGQPAAPGAVGQDHRLGHDQIQRRAAHPGGDRHRLVARRLAGVAFEAEVVVRPVEVLRLAAYHLALRLELPRETEGKRQLGRMRVVGRRLAGQRGLGDGAVEQVVPQVGGNAHPLDARLEALHRERRLVEGDIQADRRAIAPRDQRVSLHHLVGQHRQLPARHVDGGKPVARDLVQRRIRQQRQPRRRNVDAEDHRAAAQALHRERIVDLGRRRIVDRERRHLGQRQRLLQRRQHERREGMALGELLEQEAPPVELVRAVDGAGRLEQIQRRPLRPAGGLDHRLVLRPVLVRLEEDAVELLPHRLRAAPGHQLIGPALDLQCLQTLALDAQQRRLDRLLRRLAELPLAQPAEVMRRIEQPQQRRRLQLGPGGGAEVVPRQLGKAEIPGRRELPGHIQIDVRRLRLRLRQKLSRPRRRKLEHRVGRLDLDPLARIELDLERAVGLGQDAASVEFASVFEQCVHAGDCRWWRVGEGGAGRRVVADRACCDGLRPGRGALSREDKICDMGMAGRRRIG